MLKKILHILEYSAIKLFSLLCGILPLRAASNFGAFLGLIFGLLSPKSKRASAQAGRYLEHPEPQTVTKGMWKNLGRVMAEYPHLTNIAKHHVTIENKEIVEAALKGKKPLFFVSAHTGNWEIVPQSIYQNFSLESYSVYRKPNNPYTNALLEKMRNPSGKTHGVPKSKQGSRELVKIMKEGKNIGLLVDQKYNEGQAIPFFGHDAMTSTSFIGLCQKYGYTVIPVQAIRHKKIDYKIRFYEPLVLFNGKEKRTEKDVMSELHTLIEHWIRENPEQWLWLHRRWGKDNL